jgi:branched-chain amino acid transport system ATP-binding protein
MSLLELSQVNTYYGDFQALYDVSLKVQPGETFAVIGANGAGKTTLLKTMAGLLEPRVGSVTLAGTAVEKWPAPRRVEAGISLVPEGRRIFPSLTVEENLLVGGHTGRPGPWERSRVYDLFPLLVKLKDRPAGLLSGGEQQAVAIGRALMSNPRLLLLDEVSLGLAPIVVRHFYDAIRSLKEEGITIIVVEQDIGQVMSVADYVACFCQGRVVLTGSPSELTREQISTAYFGV